MTKYRLLFDKDLVLNELNAVKASNGGRISYSALEVDSETFANRLIGSQELEIIAKENGYSTKDIKQNPLEIFFKCFHPDYETDQLSFLVEDILADGQWEEIRQLFIETINPEIRYILNQIQNFIEENGGKILDDVPYESIDFESALSMDIIKNKVKNLCESNLGKLDNQYLSDLKDPISSIKLMTFSMNDVSDKIAFLNELED